MKITKCLPGIVLPVAIAAVSCWIENLLPIHLVGGAVIAMFIGMILNHFLKNTGIFSADINLPQKRC